MFPVSKYVLNYIHLNNSKVYLSSVVCLTLFIHYFSIVYFDFINTLFLFIYLKVHIPYLNVFLCIVLIGINLAFFHL